MEHELAIHPDKFKQLLLEERQKHFLLKHKFAYEVMRKLAAGFELETKAYPRYHQGALWAVLHRVMGSNLPIAWYKKKTPDPLAREIGREYWVFHVMTPSQVRQHKNARGYRGQLYLRARYKKDEDVW